MKTAIQNIVVDTPFGTEEARSLCFRSSGPEARVCEGTLRFEGTVDFLTYFNGLSLAKWKDYTVARRFFLEIALSGAPARLRWKVARQDGTTRYVGDPVDIAEGACELEVPDADGVLVGFELASEGAPALLEKARFLAESEEGAPRRVELALCTTTFKKEAYVEANMAAVKREVLDCGEDVSRHFSMFVVDNGRTLDAEALSQPGIAVIPNKNVGGSGGFARGMMAAMESGRDVTHVLLMDDDVKVSPESFKRVYALLSLVDDEHAGSFVEGAMLKMEDPTVQFEDVSRVDPSGVYERLKPDLRMGELSDVVKGETIGLDDDQAYGAWWFCCIPVEAVKANGLPLPLFVRCDDVEFGVRNKARFMALNGVCVWHEGFGGRFRPSVDCYHYVRNFLVMIAVDGCASEKLFLARCERNVRIYLRTMNYGAAELLLDGWEDYLAGPGFLKSAVGESVMKEKGAKNEKLVPAESLEGSIGRDVLDCDRGVVDPEWASPLWLKLWRALPYDRHLLPDALLRDKPAAVCYSGCAKPSAKTVATSVLVAVDETGENVCVRTIDKERYRRIRRRWKDLKKRHARTSQDVARSYREAKAELTSEAFWREYLA